MDEYNKLNTREQLTLLRNEGGVVTEFEAPAHHALGDT